MFIVVCESQIGILKYYDFCLFLRFYLDFNLFSFYFSEKNVPCLCTLLILHPENQNLVPL